ncbi:hypothetical protein AB0I98_05175 [Streptomyces sp. NPDC050211]|uniref:hypothetical protein n=1 Tax=Streptomyces sp. NPDC050211 TaxID=3154932 RepID=UPI0034458E40
MRTAPRSDRMTTPGARAAAASSAASFIEATVASAARCTRLALAPVPDPAPRALKTPARVPNRRRQP